MITITEHDIRQTEECLYINKYLYKRMQQLNIELDAIMPPSPGSILKVVGKPLAKTPLDTSETEQWAIIRATCRQAIELSSKVKLHRALKELIESLCKTDHEFYTLKYNKEYTAKKVKDLLRLDHQLYYTIRQRVIRKTWNKIKDLDIIIELAVQ